jgi:hypothetical protein
MRSIDLDTIKPLIGEFLLTIEGEKETFRIFKPTLRQKLTHRAELEDVIKTLKKLELKDGTAKQPDYDNELNRWMHRQIEIFVPEFKKEYMEQLVDDQREMILNLIFEREIEEEKEEKY